MKRVAAYLFAFVSCWALSFVQAADVDTVNVGFNFYVGAPCEYVSYPEDLHYAVVSTDGENLLKGVLTAEDRGRFEGLIDVNINNFYVIVEQPSTKFFGSVLVRRAPEIDELYFILDAFDLTWLEKAHRCLDDAECMKDNEGDRFCDHCAAFFFGKENDGKRFEGEPCCDDDCCDEYCICRLLYGYLTDCASIADGSSQKADVNEDLQGRVADSGKDASNVLQDGRVSSQGGRNGSPRYSTNSNVLSNNPYSYGASNFGTYGYGYGYPGWSGNGYWGGSSGLSSLGMLGMIGALIAVSVSDNSKKPVSGSNSSVE